MRRLQRFSIQVAHPKSGVESHVYIHAISIEKAAKKVNAAGLLVHSISPVPEEETSPLYAEPLPPAAKPRPTRSQPTRQTGLAIEGVVDLASWLFGAFGLCLTIYGVINAVEFGDAQSRSEIGIGIFIQVVFAAYRWYWRDQGPWR